MLCKKPYMAGTLPFGCGQCLPCRINKRRTWQIRMMLEAVKNAHSAFVTLTYASGLLPSHDSKVLRVDGSYTRMDTRAVTHPTLYPRDVQLWLKRLRKASGRFRYFLVGEYGDESWRPHYHAVLFGVGQEEMCLTCRHNYRRKRRDLCDCKLAKSWPYGNIYVGDVNDTTIGYTVGYVVKKLTKKDDPDLEGRFPEFARMSRRPGIGFYAAEDIAGTLNTTSGAQAIITGGDIPQQIRYGKRKYPMGRYLKGKVIQQLGYDEEILKNARVARYKSEMAEFYDINLDSDKRRGQFSRIYMQDAVVKEGEQGRINQEVKLNIRSKRRKL